jgi:hypothetical protein
LPKHLVVVLMFFAVFAGANNSFAYDVCSDDIESPRFPSIPGFPDTGVPDDSSCVHEYMAETGYYVYETNPVDARLRTVRVDIISGLRDGAAHEDEKDHIYGLTGDFVTLTHFWNPDPFTFNNGGISQVLQPYHRQTLDGIAAVYGDVPNNWEKAQAYWSRALAEYAEGNFGPETGAYHYLGHVVHHLGDNTVPTHAHVTSHAPGGRDSYENWMSNKYHFGFPVNTGGDFRKEYNFPDYNHVLLPAELDALTTSYVAKLGRIDPFEYANLDTDIPEIDGLESPIQKLLWLQYTTNQIAEFFAADRDNGEMSDPTNWVAEDLRRMDAALPRLRPRTEEEIAAANSVDGTGDDPDVDGVLSQIREYSYIRGIRAIGGLYKMFEQTVASKPILSIEIHALDVAGFDASDADPNENGRCEVTAFRAYEDCDFYSSVDFWPVSEARLPDFLPPYSVARAIRAKNEGEVKNDQNNPRPSNWSWGHAVENAGFAVLALEIWDEDSGSAAGDIFGVSDVRVRILPVDGQTSGSTGKTMILEVDLAKCMRGEDAALRVLSSTGIATPSTLSQISDDVCGQQLQTNVTGNEDNDEGIAQVSFTIKVSEFAAPEISCAQASDVWYAVNVDIPCAASDPGVGLANDSDAFFVLSTEVADGAESMSASTTTAEICDVSSNCVTAGPIEGYMIDRRPPAITAPEDIAIEATAALSIADIGLATAIDLGSGLESINSDADLSGFEVGTTVVTWTATDNVGNSATVEQQIIVADTTAPALSAPPAATVTAGVEGQDIGMATATDVVGVKFISKDAPAIFPAGSTVVTWYAIDDAGNVSEATQTVTARRSGGGAFGVAELLLFLMFVAARRRYGMRNR